MLYIFCMSRASVVVFLILFATPSFASDLAAAIDSLESEWAKVYYQSDESLQRKAYPGLIDKAAELGRRFPRAAEPKIWQATIIATNAAFQPSLAALSSLKTAKRLLEEAIALKPEALDGAAYVTLGTLYYMAPGWPISFGDNQLAEQMLQASLKINPDGIDANYFYADYLLQQDRSAEAEEYLRKAAQAPLRKNQYFADSQLQNEAKLALASTQQRKSNTGKNKFQAIFTAATYNAD